MNLQLSSNTDKYAKLKVGVIPILVLFLGYILLMPEGKPEDVTEVVDLKSIPELIKQGTLPDKTLMKKRNLPQISLAELSAHDPFQMLEILQPKTKPSTQDLTDQSDSIQEQPSENKSLAEIKEGLKSCVVQGIFIVGEKRAALIDSNVYHEGDFLENGVQILSISPEDIVLKIGPGKYISL